MLAGVLLAGAMFACGTAFGQDPQTPAPTPLHPITTKPEGPGQTCSYTGSRSTGGGATNSSTCPQPSAAQKFPYPGEDSKSTVSPLVDSPATTPTGTPNAPGTPQAAQPAAQKFPYPGDDSKANVPNSPLQDAGSSGSSSKQDDEGSSSSSSAGAVGADAVPDAPTGDTSDNLPAPKRARKKLTPPVRQQSNDEREEEDVKVATFYANDGNFAAAYLRAKDAISLDDTDPVAHFILAESARRLGKLDEAKKQYQRCLELDPLPKERKGSQKALKEMTGS